ncbi:hypothetical protein [Stenotrophomonas sp. SMYL82]|uniref:hypothetical protein n=1 Tax=Stenotrophomonas sp. SMYL82 TaxID=3076048 RepID=UPI002E79DD92|nr:hypothetical protein [Stenotrophomonas sp. SMYL82]
MSLITQCCGVPACSRATPESSALSCGGRGTTNCDRSCPTYTGIGTDATVDPAKLYKPGELVGRRHGPDSRRHGPHLRALAAQAVGRQLLAETAEQRLVLRQRTAGRQAQGDRQRAGQAAAAGGFLAPRRGKFVGYRPCTCGNIPDEFVDSIHGVGPD